jgi:predicted nucleic acid-binding protein
MTETLGDVFADTVFWVALILKRDQYHVQAQACSRAIAGRIFTTRAVLLETANALAQPPARQTTISLLESLETLSHFEVISMSDDLWRRAWTLFRGRSDKSWSLTDCASFITMQDFGLRDALTADADFTQAGFRILMGAVGP